MKTQMDTQKNSEIAVKKKKKSVFLYKSLSLTCQQLNYLAEIALLPVEMLYTSCQFLMTVSSNKRNNEFYHILKGLIKIN